MNARCNRFLGIIGIAANLVPFGVRAQAPEFSSFRLLTNKEAVMGLSAATGSHYRIDFSTNLPVWNPLVMLTGAIASVQHTDSATPYLASRYYRAEKVSSTNLLGDYL